LFQLQLMSSEQGSSLASFEDLGALAEALGPADQEDGASVASGQSWLLVEGEAEALQEDEEDTTIVVVASDGEEQEESTQEVNPIAAAMDAMAEEVAKKEEEASATFWFNKPLEVGGNGELEEIPGHQGEQTTKWFEALKNFSGVKGAWCLGRIGISKAVDANAGGACTVVARAVVRNDGSETWPEASTLRLVAGAGWGLHELPVGPLPAGHACELVLDVAVPAGLAAWPGAGERSAWVLEDGTGRPFGPLLFLEVMCI